MPLDASIPLQSASPLQSIGSLMQIRGQMADFATKQAQAADLRAQADQRNRDLNDQKTVQQLMNDPELAPKIAGGDLSSLHGRVQPKTLEALQTGLDEHQTKLLANNESTNKEAAEDLGAITNTLQGLKEFAANDANEGKLAEASAQAIATLHAQNRFRHLAPGTNIPDMFTDPSQIDVAAAHVGAFSQMTDKALSVQKARRENEKLTQEAAEKEAIAGKTNAEIPGAQATSDIQKIQRDLMQAAQSGDNSNAESLIDQRIPIGEFPESQALNTSAKVAYRLALQNGAKPAEAAAAAEKVANVLDDLRKQKGEIPGEVAKSVAVERAKAPIETARAIQVANTNRANSGAEKLDADYNQARTATDAMSKLLDLAEKGNKAAGQNVPLVGVETLNAINGIKRINSAEINQYGNAGSLLDEIKGKLGKLAEGKPIPQDVLNDIRELHSELGTQAYEKYTSGLKSLEARTPGAKLPPTLPAPQQHSASTATSYKAGDTRVINGVTYTRDDKGNWHPK